MPMGPPIWKGETSSAKVLIGAAFRPFDRIVDQGLLIRRLNLTAVQGAACRQCGDDCSCEQLDLFSNFGPAAEARRRLEAALDREKKDPGRYAGHQEKVWKERDPQGNEPGGWRHRHRTEPPGGRAP